MKRFAIVQNKLKSDTTLGRLISRQLAPPLFVDSKERIYVPIDLALILLSDELVFTSVDALTNKTVALEVQKTNI